jgi:hypothetical protein
LTGFDRSTLDNECKRAHSCPGVGLALAGEFSLAMSSVNFYSQVFALQLSREFQEVIQILGLGFVWDLLSWDLGFLA